MGYLLTINTHFADAKFNIFYMPTRDGEMPGMLQITYGCVLLEKKINALIQEFKEIYNEPSVTITEGAEYKIKVSVHHPKLMDQYQNCLQHKNS